MTTRINIGIPPAQSVGLGVMSLRVVTPPRNLPVDLPDLMDYLRVDNAADVEQIEAYAAAAVSMVEMFTGRALIAQTVAVSFDNFPGGAKVIQMPRSPAIDLVSATYYDVDGELQTLDPSSYFFDTASEPPRLMRRSGVDWPVTEDERPSAITITYRCGYGETPINVPEGIKHAIRFMVSHFYESRVPVVTGTIATKLPLTAEYLLAQHRVHWL
jgi:uncharacterized phiE125 gp8 family phage protein